MSIGGWAFCACDKLTNIHIPNNISSISECTFACSSLTIIDIPNSITSIGEGAFSGCSKLASIHIPNSVTSIGGVAFFGCDSLHTVYYSGTQEKKENIIIGPGNDALLNAEWIYESSDTEA